LLLARALAPNTDLDIHRIEGTLGLGGFGITYAAWDSALERRVAIKEYFPLVVAVRDSATGAVPARDTSTYDYGLTSCLHEARMLARFSHLNIVRVLRYPRANNPAYLVVEYEEGETLTDAIQRGTMPAGPLLRMTIRLLQGSQRFMASVCYTEISNQIMSICVMTVLRCYPNSARRTRLSRTVMKMSLLC
jgi:serine/threonine protein kinase